MHFLFGSVIKGSHHDSLVILDCRLRTASSFDQRHVHFHILNFAAGVQCLVDVACVLVLSQRFILIDCLLLQESHRLLPFQVTRSLLFMVCLLNVVVKTTQILFHTRASLT